MRHTKTGMEANLGMKGTGLDQNEAWRAMGLIPHAHNQDDPFCLRLGGVREPSYKLQPRTID